jgi:Protein of unknown function (DUF664)
MGPDGDHDAERQGGRMSSATELLVDAFDRIRDTVHAVVRGLSDAELAFRADAKANSIGWLVWHLSRVQDDHIAGVSGLDQLWFGDWYDRFGLPFDPADIGYGQASDDVAKVRVHGALLVGYHDAVHAQTTTVVRGLTAADFDRVVDPNWDPPVTMAVRLVSVISDGLQHAGQAAFVRGIVERRS